MAVPSAIENVAEMRIHLPYVCNAAPYRISSHRISYHRSNCLLYRQGDHLVELRVRQPKLKLYEKLLLKFRYRDSLDAVLEV